MMTRKHFEAIAAAVKEVREDPIVCKTLGALDGVNVVANYLATMCAHSNERFDRGRFLRACGV
jgi:hypothetical protein